MIEVTTLNDKERRFQAFDGTEFDLAEAVAKEIALGEAGGIPRRVTAARIIDLVSRQATPEDSQPVR